MSEISASILSVKKENAIKTFYNLETAKVNYFHIDVMDGKFVESNTIRDMKDYSLTISHITNLGLDVHLMVKNVDEFIDEYLNINPEYITFHIEAVGGGKDNIEKIIKKIKDGGSKVGIAISPNTSIDTIKPFLKYIHMILIMTVEPGKGGQKLIPKTLTKVKELKKYMRENNLDFNIEVDGGINDITADEAVKAGADILVVGSYLIKSKDYASVVRKLKKMEEIEDE